MKGESSFKGVDGRRIQCHRPRTETGEDTGTRTVGRTPTESFSKSLVDNLFLPGPMDKKIGVSRTEVRDLKFSSDSGVKIVVLGERHPVEG